MRWEQLIQALVDLNDGETIENDTTIVTSANIALAHLARYIPPKGHITIEQTAGAEDIPGKVSTTFCPGYIQYLLGGMAQDFVSIIGAPHTPAGEDVSSLIIVDNYILLPAKYVGTVVIDYRRRPENVTLDTVAYNGEIDVQPSCEDLLALIMAYYVWLEDEPTKAERFLQMFMAQVSAELSARSRSYTHERVKNINGWR